MAVPAGQSIFIGSQQSVGGRGRPVIDALIDGQMGCDALHCMRVGSQQGTGFSVGLAVIDPENDGREVGAAVMEAEGQRNEPFAQFIVIGSQHCPCFTVIEGDCVGRGVFADVIDADGQIKEPDGQSTIVGSQHCDELPLPLLGVCVMEGDGQIGKADVHCIFVGSQHPVLIGVVLAEISRTNMVEEGDGVIIASEHRGSPGVHEPREGSQHRTPLKLESPVFVWLSEPTTKAEMKTRRRNIFALLLYTHFLDLYTRIQFFKILKIKIIKIEM